GRRPRRALPLRAGRDPATTRLVPPGHRAHAQARRPPPGARIEERLTRTFGSRHDPSDAAIAVDFRRGFVTHFLSRNWPRKGPVKSTPARCPLPFCGEVFWAKAYRGYGQGALGDDARLLVECRWPWGGSPPGAGLNGR